VFRWKDGKLTLLIKGYAADQRARLLAGEKYLYVNGSRQMTFRRYEVLPDETLANGKMFIDLSKETERGITDGVRVEQGQSLRERPGRVGSDERRASNSRATIRSRQASNQCGIFGDAEGRRSTSRPAPLYKIR